MNIKDSIDGYNFRIKNSNYDKWSQTEYILRETVALFKNPVMLWAGGKDSTTLLWITKKLFGKVPYKAVLVDTTYKFKETYNFMDNIAKQWDIDFVKYRNEEALKEGMGPEKGTYICCQKLKTDALEKMIRDGGHDAVIVAIRRDEYGVRNKEKCFSLRENPDHIRVHPILHWGIDDIWDFIRANNIPYNPIYDYDIEGKKYKSIGCYPCTEPVKEDEGERAGRSMDKEDLMEKLRAMGYM